MCLSSVYYEEDGERRLVMERAAGIRTEDGRVTVEDILGRSESLVGEIVSVDLMENVIVVRA